MNLVTTQNNIIDTPCIKPMAHQIDAINKTINYFNDDKNTRGKIIMPCGSGKSLTSYWILDEINKSKDINRIIITVPNLILQGQIFNTFYPSLYPTHNFMCIGSDKDIIGENKYISENVKVSTNYREIEYFFEFNKTNKIIIIATYQSLNIVSEICKKTDYCFDLGIIDEAHRTVGSVEKCFSTVLFDEEIRINKRLFMTATEKVYSGKDDSIIGMENPIFYGKTIHEYSLQQAIQDDVLCDYKVATIYSTNDEINNFINNNKYLSSLDLKLKDKEYKGLMCAVLATLKAIRENGCKKIVTYHSTIKKAKIFKDLLDCVISNSLLNIGTFHINGHQNNIDKNINMNGFKDSLIGILTNSQALVEGIDIPCIDCIIFADDKCSTTSIVQSIGRSLRKFYDKKLSYVILPILTENESDIDFKKTDFNKLFNVLIALSSIDERILHEIKKLNKKNITTKKENLIINEISIDNIFKDKIYYLIDKINLKVWDKFNSNKFIGYEEAKEWIYNSEFKNIKSCNEWKKITKQLPSFIPKAPNFFYGRIGIWKGWGDFFETGNFRNINFYTYEESKEWLRNSEFKNIKSYTEWSKITKKLPFFIPKSPNISYGKRGEWKGWGDFFSNGELNGKLNYEEAKKWFHNSELKNIKSSNEWSKITKKLPFFIPKSPNIFYKKIGTWKSWGDFFETGNFKKVNYYTYEEAKKWFHNSEFKNIKSSDEWRKITRQLPFFIPKAPSMFYLKIGTWKGWGDFFETGNFHKKRFFYTYEEAKKWISVSEEFKNIKSSTQWKKITKKLPSFIPKSPNDFYCNQGTWKGWNDFLIKK